MTDASLHETHGREGSRVQGLSAREAAERLRAEGYNELPRQGHRSVLRIVLDVLREPMLALLLGAGVIYLALGDVHEALILLVFAGLSIIITGVQESRTEHALEALRDLTSPRALVIRDGERKRIAGREVVRGDLVLIAEGDRVPADAWIVENHGLQADESLLTGESVAVRKCATESPEGNLPRPGGDDLPCVWSGSLIVRGSALCVVAATGPRSEIGRIGQVLATLESEAPRLQRQTARLVLGFAIVGGIVSVAAFLLYGWLRGGWLDAALAGIALGMSMLPEEFPVVLTVFMAMGAMRLSRARVLTRRAAAIETLGSATTLCTDKTGTLTENRMRVARLWLPDGSIHDAIDLPDATPDASFHPLAECASLASAPRTVDPMEVALHEFGRGIERRHAQPALCRHYAIDTELLAMSNAWRVDEDITADLMVVTKGAPEAIADLCHLDADMHARVRVAVDAMAADGLRVLGIAETVHAEAALPALQHDFAFRFRGLVGLADPLRASVPDAVRDCREAGIRVVMITGDYPQTARTIARRAGIECDTVLSGEELATLDDATLRARIRDVTVFARIMPEQKLRIVEALKANGEIVAMTGDGVNDAPSLKAAHIGIAMGGRGSDVAREASAMVLLDDDFGSMVQAVRVGRRIYDNLRKAMGFIVAVHIPIAGLALLPLLFGLPILLTPIHIAFLEMIIDPVCSLSFEAEHGERDVMRRPPRAPDSPLFSRALVWWAVVQGTVALIALAALVLFASHTGIDAPRLRAIGFMTLVLNIIGLILLNRSFGSTLIGALGRPTTALVVVIALVAGILAMAQWLPAVGALFRFAPIGWTNFALIAGTALAMLLLLEALKPIWRGRLLH